MAANVFGARSTALQVAEAFADRAKGRVALVTGASSGLGFETARALLAVGAIVVVTARPGKTADMCERLRKAVPAADVRPLDLEMSSLASVRAAAAAFLTMGLPLHFLVLNAGVMACPLTRTADGFEQQFGVNHVAHFLLTYLLMDKLKASQPARVVVLSSIAQMAYAAPHGIRFDDLHARGYYDKWERYGHSKLANVLFAVELQRQFDKAGAADVVCAAVNPGNIFATNLYRQARDVQLTGLLSLGNHMSAYINGGSKDVPSGTSTTVYAALAPEIVKGEFYVDCAPAPASKRHPHAGNKDMARALWLVSCDLVGVPLV